MVITVANSLFVVLINLQREFTMSAFSTHACFEWCTPLVNGWVDCALFNAVPNDWRHNWNAWLNAPNKIPQLSVRKICKQIKKTHETDATWRYSVSYGYELVQLHTYISQGSAATGLGEVVALVPAFSEVVSELTVKELWKSVYICRSYCKNLEVFYFWDTLYWM